MDCSPPGSSGQVISQARIPECVAISFSRGSSWARDRTPIPWLQVDSWSLNHQGSPVYTRTLDTTRTGVPQRTRGTGFAIYTRQQRVESAVCFGNRLMPLDSPKPPTSMAAPKFRQMRFWELLKGTQFSPDIRWQAYNLLKNFSPSFHLCFPLTNFTSIPPLWKMTSIPFVTSWVDLKNYWK